MRVLCRHRYRSPCLPAAHLTRIVGPLASRHTVPNRPDSRRNRASPGITGHHRAYPGISGHIRTYPNISGHIRTYPGISGHHHAIRHHRAKKARRVPYGLSPGTASGRGVACRIVPRRIASRSVACSSVCRRIACRKVGRVRKKPVPDRVPEGRSRAVSPVAGSCAGAPVAHSRPVISQPTSATSRLCRGHG